jgi:predicted helicase
LVFQYVDKYGSREEKFDYLFKNNLQSVQWQKVELIAPQYFFIPKNFSLQMEYNNGFGVQELFLVNGVGITTAHDDFVIDRQKTVLEKRFNLFKKSKPISKELHTTFDVKEKDGWDILNGWNNLQEALDISEYIKPISYRPFDSRYIFYEDKLVWRCVKNIMSHFLVGENVGLIVPKQCASDWRYVFVSKEIADFNLIGTAGRFGSGSVFPLYLYPKSANSLPDEPRKPNLDESIVKEIAHRTGLHFVDEVEVSTTRKTFAPIDLLDYIYAVLHSPTYREKYKEFLKIDFPRIPYPEDAKQFRTLVKLGGKLRKLHLLEDVEPQPNTANYPIPGNERVEKVHYDEDSGKVFINNKQYFENVPPEAWEFYIGGYQPAQHWLNKRKGQELSYNDTLHYRRIITVLLKTIEIMEEIRHII